MKLSFKNKRPLRINLGVLVSIELCLESIEKNPINGSFCRSLGDTRRLNRWIDG